MKQPWEAVILAAGRNRGFDLPVPLLTLGSRTVLETMVGELRSAGVGKIVVITGYRKAAFKSLKQQLKNVIWVHNSDFESTLTARSLALGLKRTKSPRVLCLDGDVVLEKGVLKKILTTDPPFLVMDSRKVLGYMDDKVKLKHGRVVEVGKQIDYPDGESVGIMGISREIADLFSVSRSKGYYEDLINHRLKKGRGWQSVDIAGASWFEIDFMGDYFETLRGAGGKKGQVFADRIESKHRKTYLFSPGPVMVSEGVKQASITGVIGHREPDFSNLLWAVRKKILKVAAAKRGFTSVVIPGSGSAANESVVSSIPLSKILIVSNGEFGERLIGLTRHHGHSVMTEKLSWGHEIDWKKIKKRYASKKIDYVMFVHHETSTGTVNSIASAAGFAESIKAELIVDAISSFGGIEIDCSSVGFLTGSTNKCLASLPGLSFVVGKKRLMKTLRKSSSFYLDLKSHVEVQDKSGQTLNTPPVSLILGLNVALDEYLEQNAQQYHRLATLSSELRSRVTALGFEIAEGCTSPLLTNFKIPRWSSFDSIQQWMREEGFIIYSGKGRLAGKIFQVANMGRITTQALDEFAGALRRFVNQNRPRRKR